MGFPDFPAQSLLIYAPFGSAIRREVRTGKDQHVVLLFIDVDGFK
jgi:hypothetical protein